MKTQISAIAAALAIAFAAPAIASAPASAPEAHADQSGADASLRRISAAIGKFDLHRKGIIILARNRGTAAQVDRALFQSVAVQATMDGYLVLQYAYGDKKPQVMGEMSEKEIAALGALDKGDLSPEAIESMAPKAGDNATIVFKNGKMIQRAGAFGSIEKAVEFFVAVNSR